MHNYEGLDRPGGFDRSALLAPLRLRDFRLLWTGMTVSLIGDGIFLVAMAWQAYELSSLPTALSLVGLAMTIPHVLFLVIGGVVSDRFSKRRVMLAADVVRGLTIALLALLATTGSLTLVHLAALAAVYGAGTAFFGPAFDAVVPEIVPGRLLAQANSLDQLVKPLALRMVGPALGGLLIGAWGTGAAFGIDALTFVASAGALMMMRGARRASGRIETGLARELGSGFRFVRSNVWLWGTFSAAAISYLLFMGPAEVLLPFIVKEQMRGSAADLGMVFAIGGIGAITSAVIMGSRALPLRNMTFIYIVWTLSTVCVAGYGMARFPWQLMAASFAFNFLETAGLIVWATTKQRLVPVTLLGRVSSLDWLISIGLVPVSFALTGPIAALIGARTTLIWAGLLGAAVTLAAYFLPGMRAPEQEGRDDRTQATRAA